MPKAYVIILSARISVHEICPQTVVKRQTYTCIYWVKPAEIEAYVLNQFTIIHNHQRVSNMKYPQPQTQYKHQSKASTTVASLLRCVGPSLQYVTSMHVWCILIVCAYSIEVYHIVVGYSCVYLYVCI